MKSLTEVRRFTSRKVKYLTQVDTLVVTGVELEYIPELGTQLYVRYLRQLKFVNSSIYSS